MIKRNIRKILGLALAATLAMTSVNVDVMADELIEENINEIVVDAESVDTDSVDAVEETIVEENATEEPSLSFPVDDLMPIELIEVESIDESDIVIDLTNEAGVASLEESIESEEYDHEWDRYSNNYVYNQLSEGKKKTWDAMESLCLSVLNGGGKVYHTTISGKDYYTVGYVVCDELKGSNKEETMDNLKHFISIYKYSNPQYFFLSHEMLFSQSDGKYSIGWCIYENMANASDRRACIEKFKNGVETMKSKVTYDSSSVNKTVRSIHDTICNSVTYNWTAYNTKHVNEQTEYTQSAYSTFTIGSTVCAGYALGFELLCNDAGIDCMGVTSPGHAYNKVRVNDIWYNIDTTWADQDSGRIYYGYYLKSDATYASGSSSHVTNEEWNEYNPPCTKNSSSSGDVTAPTVKTDEPTIAVDNVSGEYKVTITCYDPSAKIYYTTDGSTPASSATRSFVYKAPVTIAKVPVIRAVATSDGKWDSEVAEYVNGAEYSDITVDAAGGTFSAGSKNTKRVYVGYNYGTLPRVTKEGYNFAGWFDAASGGKQITNKTIVTKPVPTTLYAQWARDGQVATPVPSIPGGTRVKKGTKITLSTKPYDASIYYTLDPSVGTKVSNMNGALYDESNESYAIVIESDTTIYAIAYKEDYLASEVMVANYEVIDPATDWGDVIEPADRAKWNNDASQVPEGVWLGNIPTSVIYNGKAQTFSDLRVYGYKTLLEPKVDYTVQYYRNTDAGVAKIKIICKGNYSGTYTNTFTIEPYSLENAIIPNVAYGYNGNLHKGKPTVMCNVNGKMVTLKKGADFVYNYPAEDGGYVEPGSYSIDVVGTGNYTGTKTVTETIIDSDSGLKSITESTVAGISTKRATGEEITPSVNITYDSKKLTQDEDYTLTYSNNTGVGTALVVIEGTGEYVGEKVVKFTIKGTPISSAKIRGVKSLEYTGAALSQNDISITYGDDELVENEDYVVTYSNNIKASGNAKLTIKGIGIYSGSVKKTFTIKPKSIATYIENGKNIGAVSYCAGGAKPEIVIDGLVKGKDYTVKYSNNKSINDGSKPSKIPTVTIKGKGNYKGTVKQYYSIVQADLNSSNQTIVVGDIVASGKAGKCKPKITIYDHGAKLEAGKDYNSSNIKYTYTKATTVKQYDSKIGDYKEVVKMPGETVDNKNDIISAGTELKATVFGKGGYSSISAISDTFRFVDKSIAKATFKVKSQVYTGDEIQIDKTQIKSAKLVVGNASYTLGRMDYIIVPGTYVNNVKAGTAEVTVRGIGSYGGTKVIKFKINAKSYK